MPQLILASTSVYRRELLSRLGIPFQYKTPGIDEDAEKKSSRTPQDLAEHLSALKARALSQKGAVVIGGDQLVDFDGMILGKANNFEAAFSQLSLLAGKSHRLVTAVTVWTETDETTFTDITELKLRKLSKIEIERYLHKESPYDCAGSYKIEKLGISLVEKIDTADFTAIQGLPLIKLSEVLRKKGFEIP